MLLAAHITSYCDHADEADIPHRDEAPVVMTGDLYLK